MLLSELEVAERLLTTDESKRLVITPIISARDQLGPSSVDVRLGTDFGLLENSNLSHIDTALTPEKLEEQVDVYTRRIRVSPDQQFHLHPGEFVLALTLIPQTATDLAGRIEGRSSWGRLGLLVHATAGYIDPGFSGVLTFELSNAGRLPIALKPGLRIGQVCFFRMSQPTKVPYGARDSRNIQARLAFR